jgi:hypothetical protein
MAARQPKTNPVFGQNETMDDLTAEQEELGGGGAVEQQQPPPELPSSSEGAAEAVSQEQPVTTEQPQEKEPRAERRIRELVEENRRYQQQLSEERERWARLDERSKQVREARIAAEQAAKAAERPDPSIDPVGAQLWDTQQKLAAMEQWRQQQEQQFAQLQQGFTANQQEQQWQNWVMAEANNYSRTQPDYMDAARYAVAKRNEFWAELGYSPEQAQQLTMAEANLVTRSAMANNRSFGPAIYKFAQWMGYQPANGNGKGVTPAAASQAGRTLAQVAKGQAMQGIGRAPGAGNEARSRYASMTAAEIAAVPDNVWQRDYANPQLRQEMEAALRRLDGVETEDVRYFTR